VDADLDKDSRALGSEFMKAVTAFRAEAAVISNGFAAGVVAAKAAVVGSVSVVSLAMAAAVANKLNGTGYDTILADTSHRYGRMTLSLWQQCVCRKTKITGPSVVISTVYMRPIFSGAIVDSNRLYDIQSWINKAGIDTYTIEGPGENKTVQ
jgi:hypothetical protein